MYEDGLFADGCVNASVCFVRPPKYEWMNRCHLKGMNYPAASGRGIEYSNKIGNAASRGVFDPDGNKQ